MSELLGAQTTRGRREPEMDFSGASTEAHLTVRVSVILPTFNRTRSLPAAIMSVLSQSYEDFELIVVDDGSSEDVEGLVRSIKDARLKYVKRSKNGGAAAARNTGLAEAKGRYIAFQDSDDIWLPGKLARQVALFSSLPDHVGAVTGAKILCGRDAAFNVGPGKIAHEPPPERPLRLDEDQLGRLLTENRISLQNALFRRDCLPGKVWFDTCARANEDWEFAIRLVQHTTVYEDIEPVVVAFVSRDSISLNFRKQTIGILRILNKNREVLSSRKRQRSLLLIDVGRSLYKSGKIKWSMNFLFAGLMDYPAHIGLIATILLKKAAAVSIFRRKHNLPQVPAREGLTD